MDIEQKMELCLKLLEITAESRFAIMKDIWNLQVRTRPFGHNQYRDTISDALAKLRQEIFDALISDTAVSSNEFVKEVAACCDLPMIKKNIVILYMTGLSYECIAAMNCVSLGYVRMVIRTLRDDFSEIFAEM
jgi:hypothetical protein